ncbi:MAG: hypothetical protein IJK87_00320 [Prevotella sp.]|nr:hypothetical protein [Prevotella sp.]
MKRSIFLFISYFFSLVIQANVGNFVRKEGILYQIQDGREVRINERIITVKFKNEKSVLPNDFVVIRKNQLGYIDLSVLDDTDVLKYYSKLKDSGLFEVVNMNNYGETCMVPNDTYIGSQWHLNAIRMFDAWNITTGNANVKVAVIDTEIDWQ